MARKGDECSDVTIVSRSDWGARAPKSTSQLSLPVKYVFIHHTDGRACTSQSSCSSVVRGIQNYHMDDRGWDDIGYSFLIGEDGKVYEGRGWDRVGAHTRGYNDVGIAISFMGNFSNIKPKQIALDAAKNLINCGVRLRKVSTTYILRGHRDMGTTTCPGDTLYAEIKTWPHY
ncbi:peptidoglycan recognition protein 1-like isoform X2 [Anneissia japonica]|uniref:peptidoglycan recognition protein 1-like isoform X2 n=1 Tax=Anneissia japonica TaxID=1529436 RepID=UPI001425A9D2|nr:peptidoglycan recognition protein 1-like isoform X2 [Anneissia japonica]